MNYIRPSSLDEMIGQNEVKYVLKTLINATNKQNKPLPHILFHGPAGTGKTTFGYVCAKEKECDIIVVNAASIKTTDDIDVVLSRFKDYKNNPKKPLWFIDEIHELPLNVCEYLYPIMEDFEIHNFGRIFPTPEFTIVGASTKIGKIPHPLCTRFKYELALQEYNKEELMQIVHRIASLYRIQIENTQYKFSLKDDTAKVIVKVSRGIPRIIVAVVEWIKDYMTAYSVTNLTIEKALEIIKLRGIDEHGLTKDDYRYLDLVKEYGPVSLIQLSQMLDIDKVTIQNKIEPYLLKLGKIDISPKGRILSSMKMSETNINDLI